MSYLEGNVVSATAGLQGFDTDTIVSAAVARRFKEQGFQFCIRYIARSEGRGSSDLSRDEANAILDAGLGLMPVQHVARRGWTPNEALGQAYGTAAAANAMSVGFPTGVNVWLDLEGIAPDVEASAVIDYCNAWFDMVGAAGYRPGIYVGANSILDEDALYWRLRTKHYWKSGSRVPDIPERGYQMVQRIIQNDIVNGIEIDRNVTRTDGFGDTVFWLQR